MASKMVVPLCNIALNTCIALNTWFLNVLIYAILMLNGELITVLHNCSYQDGIQDGCHIFKKTKCYMDQIVKGVFMLLLSDFL